MGSPTWLGPEWPGPEWIMASRVIGWACSATADVAAMAGDDTSVTATGVVKATDATATSLPAAPCRPARYSRGAGRPRSAACASASTATVKAAHASQETSRTAPRNRLPLSRCSSTKMTMCREGTREGTGEPPSR